MYGDVTAEEREVLHSDMTNHAKYRLRAADQGGIRSRLSTDSMLHCAREDLPKKKLHAKTNILNVKLFLKHEKYQ